MPPSAKQSGSPLIQRLHELSVLDDRLPHSRFVATVGKFIDFSEAIPLSEFLSELRHAAVSHGSHCHSASDNNTGAAGAKAHYIRARGDMMAFIVQSFITEDCPVSLRLPLVSDATYTHEDQGLGSYQRFYALHQREMESSVAKLQASVRGYLSANSPSLAQLVALESRLSEILTVYSRKALAVIPSLLAKRFHYLYFDPPQSVAGGGEGSVLQTFLLEMQSVLLAELDSRLQPTLGLIEALVKKEEESKK